MRVLQLHTWNTSSPVDRHAFPASIELGIGAILISVIIGLLLGLASALKHNTIQRSRHPRPEPHRHLRLPPSGSPADGYYVFFFKLLVVPAAGAWNRGSPHRRGSPASTPSIRPPAGQARSRSSMPSASILPLCVLARSPSACSPGLSRSSVLDIIRLDYVTAARAKDCPARTVVSKTSSAASFPSSRSSAWPSGSLLSGTASPEQPLRLERSGHNAFRGACIDLPVIMGVGLCHRHRRHLYLNFIVDLIYGFGGLRASVR